MVREMRDRWAPPWTGSRRIWTSPLDNRTIGTTDGDAALICPRCNEQCLHQIYTISYARIEDDEQTLLTRTKSVNGVTTSVMVPSENTANPSARRQGLAIGFECETCGNGIELTIAQHKGSTYLGWRFHPDNETDRYGC